MSLSNVPVSAISASTNSTASERPPPTANVPVKRDVHAVLSNSSGFGGHNVSIALRRLTD